MPLEFKGQPGTKMWRACQVQTCVKYASKRVYFMNHFMGNLCQNCAKDWDRAWEGAQTTDDA